MSLSNAFAALLAACLVFGAVRFVARGLPGFQGRFRELAGTFEARLPEIWTRRASSMIREAGSPGQIEAGALILFSLALGAFALLSGIGSVAGLPWIFPVLAGGASIAPWLWLSGRARDRKGAIEGELPFVLDLLALVVEAGNDLLSGFARIAERMPAGPLHDELLHALRELRMGLGRAEVFRGLAERTGSPAVARMSAAILQADRMGAPVGESLRILAGQLLSERFLLAEKKAAQAPVKILFPLVAFIFPAVFLVLFGPIALALLLR